MKAVLVHAGKHVQLQNYLKSTTSIYEEFTPFLWVIVVCWGWTSTICPLNKVSVDGNWKRVLRCHYDRKSPKQSQTLMKMHFNSYYSWKLALWALSKLRVLKLLKYPPLYSTLHVPFHFYIMLGNQCCCCLSSVYLEYRVLKVVVVSTKVCDVLCSHGRSICINIRGQCLL